MMLASAHPVACWQVAACVCGCLLALHWQVERKATKWLARRLWDVLDAASTPSVDALLAAGEAALAAQEVDL